MRATTKSSAAVLSSPSRWAVVVVVEVVVKRLGFTCLHPWVRPLGVLFQLFSKTDHYLFVAFLSPSSPLFLCLASKQMKKKCPCEGVSGVTSSPSLSLLDIMLYHNLRFYIMQTPWPRLCCVCHWRLKKNALGHFLPVTVPWAMFLKC